MLVKNRILLTMLLFIPILFNIWIGNVPSIMGILVLQILLWIEISEDQT